MAQSMTGYGRAEGLRNGRNIQVEIKSVNSRYFEYNARMPRNVGFLEDPLKKAVSARVSRGKCELYLNLQTLEGGGTEVSANLPVAEGYFEALGAVANHLRIENDLKASDMARFSDIFTVTRAGEDEEQVTADVLAVAGEALERFSEMRRTEGERLCEDIRERLERLAGMLAEVEKDSAGRLERYTRRLEERLREVLEGQSVDEGRLLTEAAIFADKTCVDEETVRLHSHLEQFGSILASKGAVGRKLDFLTQELNREVNTIGSKCQEVDITRVVVDMKAEIEKIREQIQNLE